MNAELSKIVDRESLPSDEERTMLRDSTRGFLEQHWPVDKALELSKSPKEVMGIWQSLAEQGLSTLGSEPQEGGVREILLIMEELGRATCPAPMLGSALVNLVLRNATNSSAASDLIQSLHEGNASVGIAFARYDGDINAGSAKLDKEGLISGCVNFVENVQHVTHLLVIADGPVLAIIDLCSASGISITATPGFAEPSLSSITFKNTPAQEVALSEQRVHDINRIARLALAARSLGAATRGFELVVEYSKERYQFGQPIGKFQAIQHKLANCLTALEGVRQTLDNAATSFDLGDEHWRVYASACYAFSSSALRQVSLETHHTFGAIGYSEEHEAPRYFRRTHGDLVRLGGTMRAREELAQFLIDQGNDLPDYDLGVAGNAFRMEVRNWLANNWTQADQAVEKKLPFDNRGFNKEFARKVGKQGWIAIAWPKEYGGQARTPIEQFAFQEEMSYAKAPTSSYMGAAGLQAPAIMKFGTSEQKAFFLPKIRDGEVTFCLGYSEPDSGSDLASLRTSAVREGDEWVINGQKIWTTLGEKSEWVWLAVRTDPQAKPKHAGISVFAVNLDTPGITIRPTMAMYGHTFCNVFYDNVRVPANALIGEVNSGWKVLTSALADERMLMGSSVVDIRKNFSELLKIVRSSEIQRDRAVRDRIGLLAAEIEVARRFVLHGVKMAEAEKVPMAEAAISKHFSGELMERLGEAALDIAGMGISLSEGSLGALSDGRIEQMLRRSIMMVIGGGTAEIQRSLIALRALNLPR